ncbi:hypothetical protein [Streptomyces sp. NPDC049879]|uniref:hypothetical protein n=1 Tax=Streptomyces sp. NPDC049879 TaxID=3365598 RepID=UPI0037A13135
MNTPAWEVAARRWALTHSPAETLTHIRAAISAGDIDRLSLLLATLDRDGAKAAADAAREIRRGLSEFRPWDRAHGQARTGLLAAAAGTFTSPAEAARWLGARELQNWDRRAITPLLALLARRDRDWRADVARRLADRRPTAWGPGDAVVVEHLVRTTGAPVPTGDGFVTAWVGSRRMLTTRGERGFRVTGDARDALPKGENLTEVLRADPFLPVLLPRLFEVDQLGGDLRPQWDSRPSEDSWTGALTALAADGTLDRRVLLGLATSRLLRGGRLADIRFALGLLETLDPTVAEDAARAGDLLRLLPDAPLAAASHAQAALARLDAAGLLTPEQLVEAGEAVFFRTEKKLLKAQLQLLERAATRQDAAPTVLRSLADALTMDDALLTARAWRLAERLLKRTGTAPDELRDAASQLPDPDLRLRAARALGLPDDAAEPTGPAAEPDTDVLPTPVTPPLPAPPDSLAETVEELAVLLTGRGGPATLERALAAVVRLAHRDRAALRAAVAPLAAGRAFAQWYGWGDITEHDIAAVVAAADDRADPTSRLRHAVSDNARPLSPYGAVLAARLEETARHIADPTGPRWPCLLATPSGADGTLTPADLVERLREHRSHATHPGPVDLDQALLRLTVPDDPAEAERWADAAETIGGDAAHATARWLRAAPPEPPAATLTERATAPDRGDWHVRLAARRVQVALAPTTPRQPLDPCFADVLAPVASLSDNSAQSWPFTFRLWPWVAPHHADVLAARLQHHFAGLADDERGFGAVLPDLVAVDAPVGPAVHLALVHGLAARHEEDRTAAVDALVAAAARGRLDTPLVGRTAAESAYRGAVKGSRFADGLTAAADAGARRTVWETLATALPLLLAEPPAGGTRHSGLPELLALATRCAPAAADAKDLIRAVEETTARGGSSRLAHEARRLHTALTG